MTRQDAIKELLKEALISDQKSLLALLENKYGIVTNQTALSRDLRKLGVIKKEVNQKMVYSLPDFDVKTELLRLAILDIKYNEVMIVIKTQPGLASFVGDYIDQEANVDILGCLAGENVVFITCHSIKNILEIYENICQQLHFDLSGL